MASFYRCEVLGDRYASGLTQPYEIRSNLRKSDAIIVLVDSIEASRRLDAGLTRSPGNTGLGRLEELGLVDSR